MSIRSQGRRAARQAKSRGKLESPGNKKGREPASFQPSKDSHCAKIEPSLGLSHPNAKHRLV